MTLAEFKKAYGVGSIGLYKSKSSTRLVGTVVTKDGERTVITTTNFDSKSPVFVYPTEIVDEESGEVNNLFTLSNKQPAEAVVTL